MDRISFQNKVKEMSEKNPTLFALETDVKADIEKIEDIEKHYDIILPEAYKDFVRQYGGGYFGLVVVYSCDCSGMFYLKDNISKEWVEEKCFLPVIDLETGDFLGFEIDAGICKSKVTLYLHEEVSLQKMELDFYEALLRFGLKCDV
ncbi:MAG: SMI1/KNR4 family protein [Lachnospiraceae bacterium]|nr:SMI1/KNR4 family protein [Lachnospiraceae bacterium]